MDDSSMKVPLRWSRFAPAVAAVVAGAALGAAGLASGRTWLAWIGFAGGVAAAAVAAFSILFAERRRHKVEKGELVAQATFLDSLVESMGTIAQTREAAEILEQTRREAERIFRARAQMLPPGEKPKAAPAERSVLFPLRVRGEEIATLRLTRNRPFDRGDVVRATVLADFAARATDNARRVLASALERHRETIRSLRDLSFNIEPVVLRDQGFGPAVRAFADQVGLSNQIQIDLDLDAADQLAEKARVGLYQIIREAVSQAIRRGPPTRIAIRVEELDGEIAAEISDDGTGERRRRSFEAIEERARTLNGHMTVGAGANGGTAVRVVLPRYAAEGET